MPSVRPPDWLLQIPMATPGNIQRLLDWVFQEVSRRRGQLPPASRG